MLVQDMFGTLQQGSSPVRNRSEATASGDRWIEEVWSKGKAVNEPQLPGHRNFADLLQQTYSNPYKSALAEDKVGDAWLTCRGKAAVSSSIGKISLASNQCHVSVLLKACILFLVQRTHHEAAMQTPLQCHVRHPYANLTVHVPV